MSDISNIDLARAASTITSLGFTHLGMDLQPHHVAMIQVALGLALLSAQPDNENIWTNMNTFGDLGLTLRPAGPAS